MSDFIPPLISSSPPPMPDFDDEEDEEDVEFGMGIGTTGCDINFGNTVNDIEKKNKMLESERNERFEINCKHTTTNNSNNNWKLNEEQDSTSQDSGLCMASHSSEGMSPLPQSDDETEKTNQNDDSSSIINNLKHSSTVIMFNNEVTNNDDSSITNSKDNTDNEYDSHCTIAYSNTDNSNDKTSKVIPNDTGQNNYDSNSDNVKGNNILIKEEISDSEFVCSYNSNETDVLKNLEKLPENLNDDLEEDRNKLQNTGDINDIPFSNNLEIGTACNSSVVLCNKEELVEAICTSNENSFMSTNIFHNDNISNNKGSDRSEVINNTLLNKIDQNSINQQSVDNPHEIDSETVDDSCSGNKIAMNFVKQEQSLNYDDTNCNIIVSSKGDSSIVSNYNSHDADNFNDDEFGNFTSVTIPNCDSKFSSEEFINDLNLPNIENVSLSSNSSLQFNENDCDDVFPVQNLDNIENFNDSEKDFSSSINNCDNFSNSNDSIPDSSESIINNQKSVIISQSEGNIGTSNDVNDEADDDFDSFRSGVNETNNDNFSKIVTDDNYNSNCNDDVDDDFDDFSDFTTHTSTINDIPSVTTSTFSSNQTKPQESFHINDTVSSDARPSSNTNGFEFIFPKSNDASCDKVQTNVLEGGVVWKFLCPLESSPALSFQWSNSKTHSRLLSALNIDARNILFGPHWNANIPRFAANLGSNPLQPIKATEPQFSISMASFSTDESAAITPAASVVPDAHFDWVGSGLTNPLDCATDKVSSSDFNERTKPSSGVKEIKILSSEAESIISLLPDLNFMRKTYINILNNK